jgi:hypothetical protein
LIIGAYLSSLGVGARSGSAQLMSIDNGVYMLICDCGTHFTLKHSTRLKNDGMFSCKSCYSKRYANSYSEKWYLSSIEKRIRSDAYAASREYSLSRDFLERAISKPCSYCGAEPSNLMTYKSKHMGIIRSFCYNGLDRVDNSIGYVEDNCIPCCKICNRAKGNLSSFEFQEWIKAISSGGYR